MKSLEQRAERLLEADAAYQAAVDAWEGTADRTADHMGGDITAVDGTGLMGEIDTTGVTLLSDRTLALCYNGILAGYHKHRFIATYNLHHPSTTFEAVDATFIAQLVVSRETTP